MPRAFFNISFRHRPAWWAGALAPVLDCSPGGLGDLAGVLLGDCGEVFMLGLYVLCGVASCEGAGGGGVGGWLGLWGEGSGSCSVIARLLRGGGGKSWVPPVRFLARNAVMGACVRRNWRFCAWGFGSLDVGALFFFRLGGWGGCFGALRLCGGDAEGLFFFGELGGRGLFSPIAW